MAHKIKRLVILSLGLWLVTAGFGDQWAEAAAGSKSSSYSRPTSSYSKPTSSPSKNVWGSRSGGGSYGYAKPAAPAGGGYTKPATSQTAPGGYTKPAAPAPGGYTKQAVPGSGGYTKPATGQTGPSATTYSKPEVNKPPAPSGGYAKPGPSQAPAVDPAKAARAANTKASAPLGSKFDEKLVQRMQRQRAAESLKAYRGEQQRFKQPVAPPSQGEVAANPVYQKAQTYSKFDYGNYYNRRNNYYGNTGWSPPPMLTAPAPVLGSGTP